MTTTETLPATAVETIDTYLAAWNETDPAARNALVERSLGADLWYRDPMLEADGLAAFDAMVAAVQAQFPGLVMRRTSDVDAHHDLVRFTWALGAPGAEPGGGRRRHGQVRRRGPAAPDHRVHAGRAGLTAGPGVTPSA